MDDAMDIAGTWGDTCEVTIGGAWLDPADSQAINNHSPDGFTWGYGGSGPSQLALAILLRFTSRHTAERHYQAFKWDCIATLPKADFRLRGEVVREWLAEKAGERETFIARGWITEDEWRQLERNEERMCEAEARGEDEWDPPSVVTLRASGDVHDPDLPEGRRWILAGWDGRVRTFVGLVFGADGLLAREWADADDIVKIGDLVGLEREPMGEGEPIFQLRDRIKFGAGE